MHSAHRARRGAQDGHSVVRDQLQRHPPGYACFCDAMSPNARVQIHSPDRTQVRALAEDAFGFREPSCEGAGLHHAAGPFADGRHEKKLPARIRTAFRTFARAKDREFLQVTEDITDFSVTAALRDAFAHEGGTQGGAGPCARSRAAENAVHLLRAAHATGVRDRRVGAVLCEPAVGARR